MLVTENADRAFVDVAFQQANVGGPWQESAARAHEFVAKVFRAFAAEKRGSSIGSPAVHENESYHYVRVESDDENFPRAVRIIRALAAKEIGC